MFKITIDSNSTQEELQTVVDILQGLMVETPARPISAGGELISPDNEKDSSGLLWDARIHSSGRSKNMNGTWKIKRGTTAEEVQAVRAELLARAPAIGLTATPIRTGGVVDMPVATGALSIAETIDAGIISHPGSVPPPPGSVPDPAQVFTSNVLPYIPPHVAPVVMWPDVCRRTIAAKTKGALTDEMIMAFLQANGIDNFAILATRSDLYNAYLAHCKI